MIGRHYHMCPDCETVWDHEDGSAIADHACPECDQEQTFKLCETPDGALIMNGDDGYSVWGNEILEFAS